MPTEPLLLGLVAAAHTPFGTDGSLNLGVVQQQAAHFIRTGVSAAFVGGTTGECSSLSLEERRLLARRWCEVVRGTPLKVVVQVGSNCLADARVLAADARQAGAVAIAAIAPSYFKPPTIETLIACCADVASAAADLPFYYYDLPMLTGLSFSNLEFLEKAQARIPSLAGIKFSNPDLGVYLQCLQADGGCWDVAWGIDEWLLAALAMGCRGGVGSSYNFAAPLYRGLWDAFERGDMAAARAAQYRSAQLIALLARYGYMGASKAVMGMLGVNVGPPRLPNKALHADQVPALRTELESLGFFEWGQRG